MVLTLHGVALGLYVAGTAGLAAALAGGRASVPRWCMAVNAAGVLCHGAALAAFAGVFGELPVVGIAPSLSSLGFVIAALAVGAGGLGGGRPLRLVVVRRVALLVAVALALGLAPTGAALSCGGPWFALHVVLGFLSCAGVAVAFAAGLLYLLHFRGLKGK